MTETDVKNAETEVIEAPAEVPQVPDTPSVEISKLEASIIKQLEYYFGDANLARDKFLQEQISKDNGWVTLDTLLTFKRLQSLSEDKKVIVDAIAKSDEGLIEVAEDREKIRRHPERPLPEQNETTRKEIYSRTVYLKGFPPQETEMSHLIEFFEPYEKIVNIVLRKYHDKATKKYLFKGSVFVTFQTKEQCEKFLAKDKLEYKETELIRKMQDDYFEEKKAEKNKRSKKEEEKTEDISHLPKGASVFMEGFGKDTSRENIKEVLAKIDETLEVAFIDYQKTDSQGFLRFVNEGNGKTLIEKITENKIKIDDVDVTVRLLEGDEETEFLKKVVRDQQARRQNKNRWQKQSGGRYNHRNNNRNNNKRKSDSGGANGPPAKKSAA